MENITYEELETAADIYDNLHNNTFYQREVDAMRSMGFSVEKLIKRLREQGIEVH